MNVEQICPNIFGIHMISRLYLEILILEISDSLVMSKSLNLLDKMIFKVYN